jgi:hypothetical protein
MVKKNKNARTTKVTLGTQRRSPYFINFWGWRGEWGWASVGVGVGPWEPFLLNAPVWRQHSDTRFLGKEKIRVKGKGRHFFSKIEPATSIFVDHEG